MSNVAKAALPVRHDRATSQALRRHDTSFRASRLALHRVNYCNRAARHYKCISKMTKTENHGKRIGLLLAWRRGALLVVTACDRGSSNRSALPFCRSLRLQHLQIIEALLWQSIFHFPQTTCLKTIRPISDAHLTLEWMFLSPKKW